MNILIVSLYPLERNTSVAISSFGIIDGLLSLGNRVTIMMPEWPQDETTYDNSRINVIRIPGKQLKPATNYISRKIRSHFGLLDITKGYIKDLKKVKIPEEYFDIVISFSDPKASHVYTKKLIRRGLQYGRWIQHWGDPLFGDITRNFWMPEFIIKTFERRLINKADKAVYVTPFTLSFQKETYPELNSKIAFVPLPAETNNRKIQREDNGILKLSYLGDYNRTFRDITPLYEACSQNNNICLTIAGHGSGLINRNNITILPRVTQSQANIIEDGSDVIVCVCNKFGTQIPGKIMYKASTKKHILVVTDGERKDEIKEYLRSYNRYFLCDNNKDSILEAINSLKGKKAEYDVPEVLKPENIARAIL